MVRVVNTTLDKTLAQSARRADSFLSRARGLMFTHELPPGEGLVIEPCSSIHMFFMRYPLDILFLDRKGRVVFLYQRLKPWRVGRLVSGARCAVELAAGVLELSGTRIGDTISIQEEET